MTAFDGTFEHAGRQTSEAGESRAILAEVPDILHCKARIGSAKCGLTRFSRRTCVALDLSLANLANSIVFDQINQGLANPESVASHSG